MPRARKAQVAPGEPYGQRQALEQMAAAAPVASAPPSPMPMPGGPQLQQAAVEQATAMPPLGDGILRSPTQRPTEPVTAGLAVGAGAGPEALSNITMRRSNIQQQLKLAADVTGNPKLAEMAARVGRPVGRKIPNGRPFG